MLRRLVNLPFAVATRAAKAFQDREDAKLRERFGETQDPGLVANYDKPTGAPVLYSTLDPASVKMDAAAVRAAMAGGRSVVLVDVRANRTGECVAGSLHMPLSEISTRVSEFSDDQLVVAWGDGGDATHAVLFFRERGIEDSWTLQGGVAAWKAAGGAVERA
jgi:rhodanese-related sulfurtransferase